MAFVLKDTLKELYGYDGVLEESAASDTQVVFQSSGFFFLL